MSDDAFFEDGNLEDFTIMTADLNHVRVALEEGREVYVPQDGLGTGLSELPKRAPKLYKILYEYFERWSEPGEPCPWVKP